jgi:hypothetical protein
VSIPAQFADILKKKTFVIDRLAKQYQGVDSYPYRRSTEVRVTYKVAPLKVATRG